MFKRRSINRQQDKQSQKVAVIDSPATLFNVIFGVLKSLIFFFICIFVLLGVLGIGIGAGYFAFLVSDTNVPTKSELISKINNSAQISKITYQNDEKVSDIKSDLLRTKAASKEISPLVKQALISTEDENFERHKGVVPKAIIRALVSDLTGFGGASGGSTITQQLIKQQVLTNETSYKRKANEILLALKTEKYFTKDEIITAYLNVSPFGRNNSGQNIAGIQEAAFGIFNKKAADLNLPQAAFIAGLPQSPIVYSPFDGAGDIKEEDNLSFGLKRKNHVLFNMYKEGFIKRGEYEEALSYDITKDFKPQENIQANTSSFLYQYAFHEAALKLMPIYYEADGFKRKEVEENDAKFQRYYDIATQELRNGGVTVKTTIDQKVYTALQEAEATYAPKIDDGRGTIQNGSAMIDNQTGRVIAFVGGRDFNSNQNNHATQTRRSPGSTIKPLIAYAPAIDVGLIGSESMLSNNSRKYRDGHKLRNYSGKKTTGFETVREALRVSDNVPVVELYQELLKVANPKDYYDKMNMVMDEKEFKYESIPVGGTDYGPTVLEQTNAFATLANEGKYAENYVIDKIIDSEGNVLYEHKVKPVEVYSKATASIMNDMMRDVVNKGTGVDAKKYMEEMASGAHKGDWVGKTGTSQEFRDYWFIASTPGVTISSWIGYDDNTPLYKEWDKRNKELWARLVTAAYMTNPDLFKIDKKFKLDTTVKKEKVSSFTGQKPGKVKANGYTQQTPGKEITSLWAKKGPEKSTFRFGIGGTDDNYKDAWNNPYGSVTSAPPVTSPAPAPAPTPAPAPAPVQNYNNGYNNYNNGYNNGYTNYNTYNNGYTNYNNGYRR